MKKLTLSFKSSRALGPASRLALAGSFAALLSHAAHADLTWDSTATATNNWSLTAGNENWLGGPVLWTQNENAIFNLASGTPEAIDVTTAGIIFNNMTFDVSGFSITSAGAGSLVLADDLASTITVTNLADTATISETIANSANGISTLTKAGNGTLILTNAANTFSNLSVSAGTLQANTNGGINQTGLGVAAASISTGATVNLLSGNTAGTFTTINNAFTGTGLLKLTFLNNTTAKNTSLANINGFSGTIQLSNLGTNSDKLNVSNQGNVAAALIVDAGSQIYNSGGTTNFNGGISITGTGNNENRGVIRLAVTAVLGGNISLAGSSTIGLDSTAGRSGALAPGLGLSAAF